MAVLSPEIFQTECFEPFFTSGRVAVAVSGGPDSMALAFLLSQHAQNREDLLIHALTVDHGLRAESWQEAESVHHMLQSWPHMQHEILKWDGDKPEQRLQEAAREARYKLMEAYCVRHKIAGLFLAHHQDDQAETFLFRLAKGSGLDGLSCMKAQQVRGDLTLLRPLLNCAKQDLIDVCEENAVGYFQDPSNEKEEFARVRLRQSQAVLEKEGLSQKRLAKTALRLQRAQYALDQLSEEAFKRAVLKNNTMQIVLKNDFLSNPFEIVLRCMKKSIRSLTEGEQSYGPREEKLEDLVSDLLDDQDFRKRTLGGVIFEKSETGVTLSRESV